jgi:hypothetical protein
MVHSSDAKSLHRVRSRDPEPGSAWADLADAAPDVTNADASHPCFSRSTDNSKHHQPGAIPMWVCAALFFLGCSSDPGPAGSIDNSPDSGTPSDFGPIGLGCSDATPCAAGLTCLGATGNTLSNSVPAGGYCTRTCARDSDCQGQGVCSALDPSDLTKTYCTATCELGNDAACGNRADLACWPRQLIDAADGRVCVPTCNDDDQCPTGTVCDGATNLCSPLARGGGDPLGSPCDPSADNTCASGTCFDLGGSSGGVCSAYCRRGTFPQCSNDDVQGVCGWVTEGDQAAGAADVGFCALRCRCDADCKSTSLRCGPHADLAGTAYPGICTNTPGASDSDCSE